MKQNYCKRLCIHYRIITLYTTKYNNYIIDHPLEVCDAGKLTHWFKIELLFKFPNKHALLSLISGSAGA